MWKKYPENKPEKNIEAIVYNDKGWMHEQKASYRSKEDIWVILYPCLGSSNFLTLNVTHYLEIPTRPIGNDELEKTN